MTKRLNIALVAVALLLVLVVIAPVMGAAYVTRTNITQGATVFIGEAGLNLSAAQMNGAYTCNGTAIVQADRDAAQIGWWASAAPVVGTAWSKKIDLINQIPNTSFQVPSAESGTGAIGGWYLINQSTSNACIPAILNIQDPTLSVQVWDIGNSVQPNDVDVTGKTIPQGEYLGFKIVTNMASALSANRWSKNLTDAGFANSASTVAYDRYNNFTEGYIDITVKDASGTTLIGLLNGSTSSGGYYNPLVQLNVSTQPYIWGTAPATWNVDSNARAQRVTNNPTQTTLGTVTYANWSTLATDTNGQYAYPPGTYTIYATSKLNGMNDNYKNAGADYTGKTVSQTVTVTLASDSLKIEANKDSVVRSKSFSVTITGKPNTIYNMWVKGTSSMTGGYDDQPPMVKAAQLGVKQDTYVNVQTPLFGAGSLSAGAYKYENGNGLTVWDDVAAGNAANVGKLGNGTFVYCNVTTSATTGTRTVEFTTTNWTKAQKYTIRAEQRFPIGTNNVATAITTGTVKSDEVDVKVEKGAVTIVAAGDQSYYLGEEIKFSGTNTETYQTFLYIIGPNLPEKGADISNTNPRAFPIADNQVTGNQVANTAGAGSYKVIDVNGDNTWSWKWGTSTVALDAGTYTIYAVSQPRWNDGTALAQAAYGTVSIIVKKPFVSATASQSTVAQGDKIFITGTAEGQPKSVKIWILGKNYPTSADGIKTESVNSDASFKYEVTQATTKTLYPGQYFVVVQHPMQNNQFDVDAVAGTGTDAGKTVVINRQLANANTKIFTLLGAGSLQGSDAAEALVQGINDPNVDDTYTKLQFLIEVPVIRIDPVGDKRVGDKFTITAQTNLAVDDEILVQVYSSSFKPTQKSQSGEFSGATGTVKVTKGDAGMNKISFDVDSSTFKPDEYIVQESAVIQVATGTALFNVLEGQAPTAAPTVVVTTAAVPTTAAPVVTTAAPTPVPTTKSPGYGALIALIGLGAVAFIVVRRH